MNLLFLLLVALPICVAQFRIQGASDGNRAAASLSVDDGGKVQYSGHGAPSSGGFSIQGASDGHSNVQAGSDGHSNFQIQGAIDAGANRYLHAAASPSPAFQESYDGSGSAKSLQYDDPSGYRVNWRSYDRAVRPPSQPEAQYTEEVQASLQRAPQRQRARARPQQHAQPQPQPQPQSRPRAQWHEPELPPVQPFENAPPEIKQLFHLQKMLPYLNIIPEPFRYENIISAQQQQPQAQADDQPGHIPESRRPSSRGKARVPSRQKRQAQRQPPAGQHIQYSTNLPSEIRQILKFQQQTPYINGIPEQFRFNTDAAIKEQLDAVRAHFKELANTPPSPAPVPAALPAAQPQYQGHAYQGQPQYQGQGNAYQGQPNIYKNQADAYQPQQDAYNQVFQSELKYSQQGQPGQGGVRPVTENQY